MKNAMAFLLCLKPRKAKLLSQTPSAIPVAKYIAQNAGFRSMKVTVTLINSTFSKTPFTIDAVPSATSLSRNHTVAII